MSAISENKTTETDDQGSLTETLTEVSMGEETNRSTQSEGQVVMNSQPERTPTPEALLCVIKTSPSKHADSHDEAAYDKSIAEDQRLSVDAFYYQPASASSNQPINDQLLSEPESVPDKLPGIEHDRNGIVTRKLDPIQDSVDDTDSEQSSKGNKAESSKVKETTNTDGGHSSEVTDPGELTADIAEDVSKVVTLEGVVTNEQVDKELPPTEPGTKPHALVKPLHFGDDKSGSNDSIPIQNGDPELDANGGCNDVQLQDVVAEIPDNNLKKSPLCLMNPVVKPGKCIASYSVCLMNPVATM